MSEPRTIETVATDIITALEEVDINSPQIINKKTLAKKLRNSISITQPYHPPVYTELMKINHGGRGGTHSYKAGNIEIDFKNLCQELAEFASKGLAASATPPISYPVFMVLALGQIMALIETEISEQHTIIIWTLWLHREEYPAMNVKQLHTLTNEELELQDKNEISTTDFEALLQFLVDMGSVGYSDSEYRLKESVRCTFE